MCGSVSDPDSFCYSVQYAAYSDSLVTLGMTINELQWLAMIPQSTSAGSSSLSFQWLLITSWYVVRPGTSHPLVLRPRNTGPPKCQTDQIWFVWFLSRSMIICCRWSYFPNRSSICCYIHVSFMFRRQHIVLLEAGLLLQGPFGASPYSLWPSLLLLLPFYRPLHRLHHLLHQPCRFLPYPPSRPVGATPRSEQA